MVGERNLVADESRTVVVERDLLAWEGCTVVGWEKANRYNFGRKWDRERMKGDLEEVVKSKN